jgi:hypothetical protein
MTRRSRALLPVVLAVPLLVAACGSESTDLPAGLGPIAYITDMALPSDCQAGNASGVLLTMSPARSVLGNPSYSEKKAVGCFPYPIAQVLTALQPDAGNNLASGVNVAFYPEQPESDCDAWRVDDPKYLASFVTKEIPHGSALVRANWFEITWRIGLNQGTVADPQELNVLYGKTAGTTQVPKILGSMVFTTDGVPAGWTKIQVIRQLNTNGWSDDSAKLQSWIQRYYDGLASRLASGQVPAPPPDPSWTWCPSL